MILSSDAIIDPRAMMVKSLYTPITNVAVSTSWCSDYLAF